MAGWRVPYFKSRLLGGTENARELDSVGRAALRCSAIAATLADSENGAYEAKGEQKDAQSHLPWSEVRHPKPTPRHH